MTGRLFPSTCPNPLCELGLNHELPHMTASGLEYVNEGTQEVPVLRILGCARTGWHNCSGEWRNHDAGDPRR